MTIEKRRRRRRRRKKKRRRGRVRDVIVVYPVFEGKGLLFEEEAVAHAALCRGRRSIPNAAISRTAFQHTHLRKGNIIA